MNMEKKYKITKMYKAAVITSVFLTLALIGPVAVAKNISAPDPHIQSAVSVKDQSGLVTIIGRNLDDERVSLGFVIDNRIVAYQTYQPNQPYSQGPFAVSANQPHTVYIVWFDDGQRFMNSVPVFLQGGTEITVHLNVDLHIESIPDGPNK